MTVLFDVGGLFVVGQTHFDTTQRRNLLTCRIKTRGITDFLSISRLQRVCVCVCNMRSAQTHSTLLAPPIPPSMWHSRNVSMISTTVQRPRPPFTTRNRPAASRAGIPRRLCSLVNRIDRRAAEVNFTGHCLPITPRKNQRASPTGNALLQRALAEDNHSIGMGPRRNGSVLRLFLLPVGAEGNSSAEEAW